MFGGVLFYQLIGCGVDMGFQWFSIEAMDFELHFGRGAFFAGRYIIGLYHALFACRKCE
jgi:hypothetical protein